MTSPNPMKKGIELIADERARQISSEGWSALHNTEHTKGQLTDAARCYAEYAVMQTMGLESTMPTNGDAPEDWPWEPQWWKPSDDILRNLTKAGALIAAEIDRLQLKRRHTDAIQMKNGRGLADS